MSRLLNQAIKASAIAAGFHRLMEKRRSRWHAEYDHTLEEISRKYHPGAKSHFMIETVAHGESLTQNYLCRQFAHQGLDLPLEKRASTLIKLLAALNDYFIKHQIEYWLDGGTLLGSHRDGHIIPWDKDADLCMQAKTLHRLLQIVPAHPFDDPDCLLIFRKSKYTVENPILAADVVPCILVNKHNGVFVDIFLCHELNARWLKMYWPGPCHKCGIFGIKFRKSTIFPLKPITLEDREYPSPNQTVKYLKRYYGDLRPRRSQ